MRLSFLSFWLNMKTFLLTIILRGFEAAVDFVMPTLFLLEFFIASSSTYFYDSRLVNNVKKKPLKTQV